MNFPWLTDEEVDELKRFKKHHDKEDHDHQHQTNSARRASSPGHPPSYSMREPRRGLSLHSIHLLSFDVTLISRRDQSQARRC